MNYVHVDLKGPTNIAKIIQDNSDEKQRMFISNIMKIPPLQLNSHYNAVAVFSVSRKILETGVIFFLASRDDSKGTLHSMPNITVGKTDVLDNILQKLLL